MDLLISNIDNVSKKNQLLLTNELVNDFFSLEDLLNKDDVRNYRNEIIDLTKKIISYWNNIWDFRLKHDYNNAIMSIWKIQMIFDWLISWDFKKIFWYAKSSVEDILWLKSLYDINDIKNILVELSFINSINIDMKIEDWFSNYKNVITAENWNIISSNKNIFEWENLKNIFPDINLEVRRIFQNLVKNSKEAWATNILITFWKLLISWKLIIKYIDNWNWMSYNIIKDVLFKKWLSTKLDSSTNKWEWMNGLSKMFYENNVDIDIYSKNLDSWFVWVWILADWFKEFKILIVCDSLKLQLFI